LAADVVDVEVDVVDTTVVDVGSDVVVVVGVVALEHEATPISNSRTQPALTNADRNFIPVSPFRAGIVYELLYRNASKVVRKPYPPLRNFARIAAAHVRVSRITRVRGNGAFPHDWWIGPRTSIQGS